MTEIAFAKQFLTALDARPQKLSSDHVADAKQYPAQPAYILPRHPTTPQKRKRNAASAGDSGAATSSIPTVNVTLKSIKGAALSLSLQSQPLATSIYDLKTAYASEKGYPADKIKLLYNKKPSTDSKTIAEVAGIQPGSEVKDVELSVMVLGGATPSATGKASSPSVQTPEPAAAPEPPVAQGPSGQEVLQTEEFWNDLQGFLLQRLRDESEGKKLVGIFREAWEKEKE